jgi:hypothetical protein
VANPGLVGVLIRYYSVRTRPRRRSPDFALSSETPGGYVGQAVLETAGMLQGCVGSQRLEGSRFGSCPDISRYFFLMRGRSNRVLNRRLPGITAREVFSHRAVRGFLDPFDAPLDLSRVETFPGAACSRRFAVIRAPRQISRGLQARSKAAPLQALGTNTPFQHASPFDDEDEYD